jgi:hypothetical protein
MTECHYSQVDQLIPDVLKNERPLFQNSVFEIIAKLNACP